MKKIIIIIFLFLLNLIPSFAMNSNDTILPSTLGVVKKVEYANINQEIAQAKQIAKIEILKGDFKGEIIDIENVFTGNPCYDIKLTKGTKVILHVENVGGDIVFSIADIQRANILAILALLFCGLLIYVGRKKGLFSLVSIAITALLIVKLLSPMILFGISPIFATLIICLLSTAATMYLVGGFNKKSTSATLGCILSIIVAGILSIITVKFAHLTGFSNEHSMFLYSAHPELNFIGIAISAIILATLGAVMDVAMSIASTINEIYTLDNSKTVGQLFRSGMNVGRDIIGTMANTLILVYLGGALPLLLLSSNIDLQKFINLNQVVTEISAALIGSCAIVICVPITAIVASSLIKKQAIKISLEHLEE